MAKNQIRLSQEEIDLRTALWHTYRPEDFSMLLEKRRKLPVFARNQPCPLDGVIVKDHPCCASCAALSGAAHTIKELVSGLCESCTAARARRGQ